MESDFTYPSSTGKAIYAKEWKDERRKQYKGIVQLVHGMQEYIGRYTPFAKFLVNNGYIVVGHDHLGHGNSVEKEEDYGYFADQNGWDYLVEDIHLIQNYIHEKYPQLPYIIMGHSMGSLLVRTYNIRYRDEIDGIILSGTSGQKKGLVAGKLLIKGLELIKGKRYRSTLIEYLVTGSFNRKFQPRYSKADWISRDREFTKDYEEDKKCGINFTLQGYYDLLEGSQFLTKKRNIKKSNNIPILMISGEKDPVGENRKGVLRVYHMLQKVGIEKVRLKFFKEARHDLLNEINKEEVYDFILDWIDDLVK